MAATSLSRTPSSTSNRRTFTLSTWCKIMSSSTGNFLGAGGSGDQNHIQIESERFQIRHYAGGNDIVVNTNALLRDPSGWYHVVCAVDTTQSTDTNRIKLYINGELQTLNDTTYPSQNYDWDYNVSGETMYIGRRGHSAAYFFDGEMSHFAWVDGQQLTPSTFGETDSTSGIWKWKEITGVTWGTNGFYLKFENSGNLGLDSSGQGNNFTLSGNGTKIIDNPSISYATLNPLVNINSNLTLSNCNNTMTLGSTSWIGTLSSLGVNTGKWYWEIKVDTNNFMHGILGEKATMKELSTSNSGYIGKFSNGYAFYYQSPNARKQNNNSQSNYGTTPSSGDILMVAFDATNGTIWVGKNGSWFNSATQSEIENGTTSNSMYSSIPITETFFPAACGESNHVAHYNFGNGFFGTTAITSAGSNGNGSLFEYDVPSGYYALNTKNINTYG